MKINAQNIIDNALIREDFMKLMKQYQDSQETCESFEGKYELYDLYEDLSNLYIYNKK